MNAELEAENIVRNSEQQREAMKQQALSDANATIEQFNARLPELHQSFLDKANERAEQSIAELKLRYDEHNQQLRQLAEKHQQEALTDAIHLLLNREG
ncbi:MAG: ATPase [Gammaproteobacteria bacterium]|nr:ATPase [Gammaproteobacteria bacterium]MBT3488333.1 ATPase [Gammaproteobacteria bacterium]MBT3717378.1 ATPase [Gammaproteobacteria bacterium]MBT3845633.1 ATPase [Gammaproteobacteria bacterium]MBT3892313.1 ATPase [Gammaproteobacteria bacterium]